MMQSLCRRLYGDVGLSESGLNEPYLGDVALSHLRCVKPVLFCFAYRQFSSIYICKHLLDVADDVFRDI